MKRTVESFATGALALAAALALTGCNRPEEPGKPGVSGSAAQLPDATASGTLSSSGSSSTSPEAPTRSTAGADVNAPGAMIEKNPTAAGTPPSALSAVDESFLKSAAEEGAFEVEVARLAADHASDSAVKSYAAMLVDQRSSANDRLRQLAASSALELPSGVPASRQKLIDQLSKASGPEFDKQFVQTVGVKENADAIALYEKAGKTAKSPEVRDFANATLPTLKAHLDAAKKLPARG
jgi:putative membrane protein